MKIAIVPVLMMATVFGTSWRAAGADDLAATRERIKAIWRSVETIRFRSIEVIRESASEASERTDTYDFARDGLRSALILDRATLGENFRVEDMREDGRRRVIASYFRTGSRAINRLTILRQEGTAREYKGPLFRALWAALPGGLTIGSIVEDGGDLSRDGKGGLFLSAHLRDRDIRCELDEDHGFMPRSVTIKAGESEQSLVVDRFTRDNGVWFPAEGSGKSRSVSKDRTATASVSFRVEDLAINRPIPSSRFDPPALNDGAIVSDRVAGTTRIQGGRYARTVLVEAHPAPPKSGRKADVPIVAASGPIPSHAPAVLTAIAAVSGAGGLLIRLRRGRRRSVSTLGGSSS